MEGVRLKIIYTDEDIYTRPLPQRMMTRMQSGLEELSLEEARQKLRFYTALDHPIRLKAFFLITKNPSISFNEIRKTLKVEKGHLAYHLGILKVGGLINFEYERKGRLTSSYNLTHAGKEMFRDLARRAR